jgi:hypothetical protein
MATYGGTCRGGSSSCSRAGVRLKSPTCRQRRLALIAGPAMVRMLIRFRERFEMGARRHRLTPRRRPGLLAGGSRGLASGRLRCSLAPPTQGPRSAGRQRLDLQTRPGGRRLSGEDSGAGNHLLGRCSASGRRAATRSTFAKGGKTRSTSCAQATVREARGLARTILARGRAPTHASSAARTWSRSCLPTSHNGSYEGWPNRPPTR